MKPPALELLPGTRGASTYFPPRCDLPRDGPHDPLHPGQIFSAYSRFSHLLKRNKTWDTSQNLGHFITYLNVSTSQRTGSGSPDRSTQRRFPVVHLRLFSFRYLAFGKDEPDLWLRYSVPAPAQTAVANTGGLVSLVSRELYSVRPCPRQIKESRTALVI